MGWTAIGSQTIDVQIQNSKWRLGANWGQKLKIKNGGILCYNF